jgi:hypothetical protein
MDKNLPLVIAGIIFSLVALGHLLRLIYSWPALVGGYALPMNVSIWGLIVAALLALWMFIAASRRHHYHRPPKL